MRDYNYQGESFINRLYKDLHMSDEVMHTASPSDTKDEKLRKYLERLEKVEELAKNSKYNGIELLKEMYYKKYVIKSENVPDSYFETQKKIALERGYGHLDYTDELKAKEIDVIINDQKKSLDIWLDYLMSDDSIYPEWFKYYAFQGMLKLGSYDKEKAIFNKRTVSTTNIFVDLNREVLALVYDNLCSVLNGQRVDDEVLQKLLENGSFSKLYAYMLKKIDSSKKYLTDSNEGIWVKYDRGSEPDELVKSLEGKGTGWCTGGIRTARTQLQGGDFHVYYTKDSKGEYKQPRIAIRMEGSFIAEVRVISEHQNLESEMEEILDKKLEEFPDKDKYQKKVRDMETLTLIYKEYKNRELTSEELRFLYEVDGKVEGFGYSKDPRIEEILAGRNFKKDLARVFGCKEKEVSNDRRDILQGKKIVCFFGDLHLDEIEDPKNFNSPYYVSGNVFLNGLESTDGLNLPAIIGESLALGGVEIVESLEITSNVGENIYLNEMKSVGKLTLLNDVGGTVYLSKLKKANELVFPKNIGGSVFLDSLESTLILTMPINVGGDFNLGSFKNGNDLVFPVFIGGNLIIASLESANCMTLSATIGGFLNLGVLPNTASLIIPKNFSCPCLWAEYFTIDDLKAKSLENNELNSKQRGFSKVGILIILNLIVSIGLIFLGVWLDL